MSSDLQALLAAIVADPSDDVARLVYADCLEEHENAARAAFIRLQIEAERHHPDSNTRAALDRRASALFEQHWVEWWAEVCAATGFPPPVPRPATRLSRFAKRLLGRHDETPLYGCSGYRLNRVPGVSDPKVFGGFSGTWFRRGFPDDVYVSGPSDFLRGWVLAAPIHTLTWFTAYSNWWFDGPHLAGVRAVLLANSDATALPHLLGSPHFGNLEDLNLSGFGVADTENGLGLLARWPRVRQLKRLTIMVWDDRSAERLASAGLAGLESLWVSLQSEPEGTRLAVLARSPHLANLKELEIVGGLDSDDLAAAIRQPSWTGLRRLALHLSFGYNSLAPLAEPDGLPQLEELELAGVWLNAAEIDVLARSPLLKRLRHFALAGTANYRPILKYLADALDANRVETFTLDLSGGSPNSDGTDALRKHFGDKLRVLSH